MIVTLLAIFLVFVVMAIQYESVSDPLVILFSIPLALIGVGLLLWLTGTPLSAPVLLGVILLAGIVVNNAILLVQYVEIARREKGLPVRAGRGRGGRRAPAADPHDHDDHGVRHAAAGPRPGRGLGADAAAGHRRGRAA